MIPLQLTLKHFLSYREATLDFQGLHVACICGANGAGKSSLLEAIAWAVWGQSRTASDDDVIHHGETEARVDYTFSYQQQVYRIIRTRYRGQTSGLEFQVQVSGQFRALTARGMRETQKLIRQHLKLDYDTFINSAYLRQGRADEFMLKRPSERKQILADLLKLDQYDLLEERAKERSRQIKAEIDVLERELPDMAEQLQREPELMAEQCQLEQQLQHLQQHQDDDQATLQHWLAKEQQRQSWEQQLTWQRQQRQALEQECDRIQRELTIAQAQQQQLATILQEAEAIAQNYARWQALQQEEERQTAKFQAHQGAMNQLQLLQAQQAEATSALRDQQRQLQLQLDALAQQEQELQNTLRKADDVATAMAKLHQARARLHELDNLQLQASPLLQRRQVVHLELERAHTRLSTRLEELRSLSQTLSQQQQQQPQLQQVALEVTERITYLEKRSRYQQQVLEKGTERRKFLEQLQERQRELETQLAELDQKIRLLQRSPTPTHAHAGEPTPNPSQEGNPLHSPTHPTPYPPCPLCDRPLDEHHLNLVLERHQAERQEVLDQIWVLREQLTTSEREIKVLRQEYRDLDKELAQYGAILEQRGKVQEQLQGSSEAQQRLQQLLQEQEALAQTLQTCNFAPDLQTELRQLDQTLSEIAYDDKNHALARGEVDRWRWAEVKQAEMKQAQRHATQIADQRPQLEARLMQVEQELQAAAQSPLQQQIAALDRHIAEIDYDLEEHTAIREALRRAQIYQTRYQELLQAQQSYPQAQQRVEDLTVLLQERSQALQTLDQQFQELQQQLQELPDTKGAIAELETRIQQHQCQRDEHITNLGRIQQQQEHLEALKQRQIEQRETLQKLQRQLRIYQELTYAFSKNGIQALMIENVLPQLEAEANQILGRLSNHQLHLQFVTQKAGRSKGSRAKLIDTLEILINDARGTRSYETYSGGEAFRVNFAIRLALARLLAQRSGTPLQLLIVDEGFGTQDEAGCDRLISAINAIAPDFACILTVTHIPHLKEAFQARIEVSKTDNGSQICLLV
jgi:exonuclease SbcC